LVVLVVVSTHASLITNSGFRDTEAMILLILSILVRVRIRVAVRTLVAVRILVAVRTPLRVMRMRGICLSGI
jgi:hypothetical protein